MNINARGPYQARPEYEAKLKSAVQAQIDRDDDCSTLEGAADATQINTHMCNYTMQSCLA